jgi:TrmH family RNA methyltransferase
MGSFTRVILYYHDLVSFFKEAEVPLIAAVMNGESSHTFQWPEKGIICIGNESNGISDEVIAITSHRLTIPQFGKAESLNAGIATALLCDGMRRSFPN